jgi:hypothetical protein
MVEDTEEIETEFEVERILAQRLGQDGKVKYLVKWKDYADVKHLSPKARTFY